MPDPTNTNESRPQGLYVPNSFQCPNEVVDELLSELSGSELKVLLYIVRRTFGFQKESDTISLSQMLTGIVKHDGTRMDRGAGIKDKKTLLAALRSLEEKGLIFTERRRSAEKGNEPTAYHLNLINFSTQGKIPLPLEEKSPQGGGGKIPPSPRGENPPIQNPVLQNPVKQNISISKDEKKEPEYYVNKSNYRQSDAEISTPPGVSNGARKRGRPRKTAAENEEEHNSSNHRNIEVGQRTKNSPAGRQPSTMQDLLPLGESLMQRYASFVEPPNKDEVWHDLKAFFHRGFSVELRDEANITSTVTRAYNLFKRKQEQHPAFDFGAFVSLLYEAKSITQDRSGSIKKTNEHGFTSKMAYFFAVLEDKLGFKQPRPQRVD